MIVVCTSTSTILYFSYLLPYYRITDLPIYRFTVLPYYRNTVLPCYRAIMLPCYRATVYYMSGVDTFYIFSIFDEVREQHTHRRDTERASERVEREQREYTIIIEAKYTSSTCSTSSASTILYFVPTTVLPYYRFTVLPYYRITVLPYYRAIVLSCYRATVYYNYKNYTTTYYLLLTILLSDYLRSTRTIDH